MIRFFVGDTTGSKVCSSYVFSPPPSLFPFTQYTQYRPRYGRMKRKVSSLAPSRESLFFSYRLFTSFQCSCVFFLFFLFSPSSPSRLALFILIPFFLSSSYETPRDTRKRPFSSPTDYASKSFSHNLPARLKPRNSNPSGLYSTYPPVEKVWIKRFRPVSRSVAEGFRLSNLRLERKKEMKKDTNFFTFRFLIRRKLESRHFKEDIYVRLTGSG